MKDPMSTKETATEVVKIAYALVRAAGDAGLPSGHLYAHMMSVFPSLQSYESMVSLMESVRMIRRAGQHVLHAVPL